MEITVVATGFIGGVLGRALANAGHDVTFASRHPDDDDVAGATIAKVMSVPGAMGRPGVVLLTLPGNAVGEFAGENHASLAGKLVIDATNKMGEAVANARGSLPTSVRYARAFNSMGGEVMRGTRIQERATGRHVLLVPRGRPGNGRGDNCRRRPPARLCGRGPGGSCRRRFPAMGSPRIQTGVRTPDGGCPAPGLNGAAT
jgi:NADP oxidoreductase coenzyme F420-dependent